MTKRKLGPRADRILSYLSAFEQPEYVFGKWSDTEGELQHFVLGKVASRFVETLYEDGWMVPFDWPRWQGRAEKLTRDAEALSRARTGTLRKLLCLHVRKNRFCEGHLAAMFESGHILRILRRLADLQPRRGRNAPA
jgi:hypothetical protein